MDGYAGTRCVNLPAKREVRHRQQDHPAAAGKWKYGNKNLKQIVRRFTLRPGDIAEYVPDEDIQKK